MELTKEQSSRRGVIKRWCHRADIPFFTFLSVVRRENESIGEMIERVYFQGPEWSLTNFHLSDRKPELANVKGFARSLSRRFIEVIIMPESYPQKCERTFWTPKPIKECGKDAYGPTRRCKDINGPRKKSWDGIWVWLACPEHGGPSLEEVSHCGSPCDFCGESFSGFLIKPCAKRVAKLPKMYSCRYLVSNTVGRPYWAEPTFWASSLEDAERICEEKGWEFVGQIVESMPAPEMDDFCNQVQAQRDRDWMGT